MTRGDTTMKGILITNAFMRQGSFARMRELFEQAAQRAGVSLIPRVNTDFMLMPPSAHLKVDFVLFYDKDIRLAARLEAMGLPVFNGAKAIALCDDKTLTYLALQRAGVRQPDTVLCPQTFPGLGYGDMDFLEGVGAALSWPMVIIRPLSGRNRLRNMGIPPFSGIVAQIALAVTTGSRENPSNWSL